MTHRIEGRPDARSSGKGNPASGPISREVAPPSVGRTHASRGRIPALDGLRALSILVVMVSHSGLQDRVPGVFGVTVFFFISGFLVTTLLTDEYARRGRIAVGAFYMRRLVRLYPPLLAFVAVSGAAWLMIGERLDPVGVLAALLYVTNYLVILAPERMQGIGGQLWSLAVEEHFYLVFPWLMLALLPRRPLLVPALVGLCLAALVVRIGVTVLNPDAATAYTGIATECRIDAILFGALAAILRDAAGGPRFVAAVTQRPVVALSLAILLATFLFRDPFFRDTWRYTIQSLALVAPILLLTSTDRLAALRAILDSRPLVAIGILSYSLYLWHLAGLALGEHLAASHALPAVAGVAIGWAITFVLAGLSYRVVERPFLGLRRRFGSHVEVPNAVAPDASTPAPSLPSGLPRGRP